MPVAYEQTRQSFCVQMFAFAVSMLFLITCGLGKLPSAFRSNKQDGEVNAANYKEEKKKKITTFISRRTVNQLDNSRELPPHNLLRPCQ